MLTGNNGILTRVREASKQTDIEQEKEIIKFAYNSVLIEKVSNGDSTAITSEDMNEELVNQGATAIGNNPITVTFTNSKRQYTINNGSIEYAGLKETVEIDALAVKTSPSTYYGKTVNYSIKIKTSVGDSQNIPEDGKWKIFYSDGEHIFLIPDGYLAVTPTIGYVGIQMSLTGLEDDGEPYSYATCWTYPPTWSDDKTYRQDTLFKATGYTLNSNWYNSKCVRTLLDTNNWTNFVDTTYANYAIGGPTLEMFVDSWNDMEYLTLYTNTDLDGNNRGYYVGTGGSDTTDFMVNLSEDVAGYGNTLYFPHQRKVGNCAGYRLASPSADTYGNSMIMYVYNMGYLYNGDDCIGSRPIVALKSDVKLEAGTTYDFNISK